MYAENDTQNNRVRLNLVVTKQLNELIEKLADENGTSKSDILRKALALYEVASESERTRQQDGRSFEGSRGAHGNRRRVGPADDLGGESNTGAAGHD